MQSDVVSQEEQADMFLDLPDGLQYGTSRGSRQPGWGITGDNLGEYGTYDLLKRALQVAPLKPGGVFYLCAPGGTNETLFRLVLRDVGLPLHQSLIWNKHHFVLSRHDYHWRHEVFLYGWKPGRPHLWNGGRTQTTVWDIPRLQKSVLHPTTKPLSLMERAIRNSSREGEIVYDGFGGSGTTLFACEGTGRKCRMVEIEPLYCEVILRQWEYALGR